MQRGFGVIDEGDLELLRGDLARVLYDATCPHVRYRFGDSLTALRQSERCVRVTFESGERAEYELVIGADGVHSRTRQLGLGEEDRLVRPLGSAMAIFTAPNHLGLVREQLLYNGIRRIASVKSAAQDRELKVCVFFALPPGVPGAPGVFDPRDVQAQRLLVQQAFSDAGWEFPRLLDAMWSAEDFYSDVTCQVRMERFHAQRVALVGDAAYCPSPLSGQGTSLALVGAYVLASALAGARGDHRAAFAEYDAVMRPFAVRNQDIALRIGGAFAPHSALQLWARNLALRVLPYLPGKGLMMKLAMREISAAARDIELPAVPPIRPAPARGPVVRVQEL